MQQSSRNLKFLEKTNSLISESLDWQVTSCFYTALHLMNAHLAFFGLHYSTHVAMDNALNPFIETSIPRVPEDIYVAYKALSDLSRRSRYLVQINKGNVIASDVPALIHSVHLARAIRHLNTILAFYGEKYKTTFDVVKIKCVDIKSSEILPFFDFK